MGKLLAHVLTGVTLIAFRVRTDFVSSFCQRHGGRSRGAVLWTVDDDLEDDVPSSSDYDLGIGKHKPVPPPPSYDLGIGKNKPVKSSLKKEESSGATLDEAKDQAADFWTVSSPVIKPEGSETQPQIPQRPKNKKADGQQNPLTNPTKRRKMIARDQESAILRGALWDEEHFSQKEQQTPMAVSLPRTDFTTSPDSPPRPTAFYPNIDLSIPDSVYTEGKVDLVWDLLRWEAYQEVQREPLLVSFLYSTILNHQSLESSLSFMLANRLQSPGMMISTQLQSIIYSSLQGCPTFRRALRADIMAVRDRDPAVNSLPDVFLYFKGFHALQSYRKFTQRFDS